MRSIPRLSDLVRSASDSTSDIAALPPLLFESANGNSSDYSLIHSKPAILRKLNEIQRSRVQFRIHLFVDGEEVGVYNSSIQRVDGKNGTVILHQLSPNTWRAHIVRKQPVTISCYLKSGHLVFDTLISPLDDEVHNPFCELQLPASMHVQQLRSSYRVMLLPNTASVELRIGRHLIHGKCLDLSLNGCCAQFPPSLADLLRENDEPSAGWLLRVYHEGRELFLTNARICRKKEEVAGLLTVGLNFSKAEAERNRVLQPLLVGLQRERIRQQPLLD
ncbi:MAG: PilZ domain-containing protein [Pseudomonadota bacterium]